jgi:phosphoribosyl-ATP pyrophosphohydrolase
MTPFFLNKGFHPRMSFDVDLTKSISSRERLQMKKARDITAHMQKALKIARKALQNVREAIIKSADKKRKEIVYNPGDLIFLSSRNIKTVRPLKKLDNKMLGPFKILKTVKTFYRLQLPITIRIHDIFHRSLLRKAAEDSLPEQMNKPP